MSLSPISEKGMGLLFGKRRGMVFLYQIPPFQYMDEFRRHERGAREHKRGFWRYGLAE